MANNFTTGIMYWVPIPHVPNSVVGHGTVYHEGNAYSVVTVQATIGSGYSPVTYVKINGKPTDLEGFAWGPSLAMGLGLGVQFGGSGNVAFAELGIGGGMDASYTWVEDPIPPAPNPPRDPWPPIPPSPPRDPLVLDLDGDGVELVNLDESTAYFDFAKDGFREKTGWVSPDDALLVKDVNSDGIVNGIDELFGSPTEDGFKALSTYDSNKDGLVDQSDTNFNHLKLWRDLDGDGTSDAGELFALSTYNVKAIEVAATSSKREEEENTVLLEGNFVRSNGTKGDAEAILFRTNVTLSKWEKPAGFEADPDALLLPNLRGYGILPDLAYSMTSDASLLALVEDFVRDLFVGSAEEIRPAFVDLLFTWAGVSGVDPESRGELVDAREVAFLGKYFGALLGDAGGIVNERFAARLNPSFDNVADTLLTRFLSQVPNAALNLGIDATTIYHSPFVLLSSLGYDHERDEFQNGDPSNAANLMFNAMSARWANTEPNDIFDMTRSDWLARADEVLAGVIGLGGLIHEYSGGHANGHDQKIAVAIRETIGREFFAQIGNNYASNAIGDEVSEVWEGTTGSETIEGFYADVFLASPGDDVLISGGGSTFIVTPDSGSDVIVDSTRYDTILFDYRSDRVINRTAEGTDTIIEFIKEGLGQDGKMHLFLSDQTLTLKDDHASLDSPRVEYRESIGDSYSYVSNTYLSEIPLLRSHATIARSTGVSGYDDLFIKYNGLTYTYMDQFLEVPDDSRPTFEDVDIVMFSDREVLTRELLAKIAPVVMEAAYPVAYGTSYAETFIGSDGNDRIFALLGDDVISGGKGDDDLHGDGLGMVWRDDAVDGNDTYIYKSGDGNDFIIDREIGGAGTDELFLSDLEPGDIVLANITLTADSGEGSPSSGGKNLVVVDKSTGQRIEILDQFAGDGSGVEMIRFADGTILNRTDIVEEIDNRDPLYNFSPFTKSDSVSASWSGLAMQISAEILLSNDRDFEHDALSLVSVQAAAGGTVDLTAGIVTFTRDPNFSGLGSFSYTASDGTSESIQVVNFYLAPLVDQRLFEGTSGVDTLHGSAGDDELYGLAGNDVIVGAEGNDLLDGGAGADSLDGFLGEDWAVYDNSSAGVTVNLFAGVWLPSDKMTPQQLAFVFGENIPAEVTYVSLDLSQATQQQIALYPIIGRGFRDDAEGDVLKGIENLRGSSFDDVLNGNWDSNTIVGAKGNDELNGSYGDDRYLYMRGDGDDVIVDGTDGGDDELIFANVSMSDVAISRDNSDFVLTVLESEAGAGDGGTITIKDSVGGDSEEGIDSIVFSDGEVWSRGDLLFLVTNLTGDAGNNTIVGSALNERLSGGRGDDLLLGEGGNDTYVYFRGDGRDTIADMANADVLGNSDWLEFQVDISPDDVKLSRINDDLIISLPESAPGSHDEGVIVIQGQFRSDFSGVEIISFVDGMHWVYWNYANLLDELIGDFENNEITGSTRAQTVIGERGDDVLNGGGGNDTYIYARGDGRDTITEVSGNGLSDRLLFSNVGPGEVKLTRSGNDLLLTIAETVTGAGDSGSILVRGTLGSDASAGVEEIVFADGTIWSRAVYINMLSTISGDDGNNTLTGTSGDDTLTGRGGDDALNGGSGQDTYIYARGDGNDTITEGYNGGTGDQMVFSDINADAVTLSYAGSDLTITIAESAPGAGNSGSILIKNTLNDDRGVGVDKVVFADGTTWSRSDIRVRLLDQAGTSGNDTITGFNVADTLRGRGGDDALNGGTADDTYIYARGDGNDTITEGYNAGSNDQLVFTDINAGAVTLAHNGSDLTITIAESAPGAGNGGSILIQNALNDDRGVGVDKVVFADGTTWSRADLRSRSLDQAGTSGNDTIIGFNVADTLRGRGGDDALNGGTADDTYVYARGDGNDTITEGYNGGTGDQLVFVDINAGAITLAHNGSDLTIAIAETASGAGDGGAILIKNTLDDDRGVGVDKVVFADGTTWSRADIRARLLDQAGTSGNDTITGFNVADTLRGRGGDDALNGGFADDTYVYARGDGNDTITEAHNTGSNDKLQFININRADITATRNGTDLTLVIRESASGANDGGSIVIKGILGTSATQGIERIEFADGATLDRAAILALVTGVSGTAGDDTINGTAGADDIQAGLGNDRLIGAAGNDSYFYNSGDGNDTIEELTTGTDIDRLMLVDLNQADIRFERPLNALNDVVLRVLSTNQTITLKTQLDPEGGVEKIVFADGSMLGGDDWSLDATLLGFATIYGTPGNDTIWGSSGDDTIDPGAGNDTYGGEYGSDTLLFGASYGNDFLNERADGTDTDTLKLVGLNQADVRFERPLGDLTDVIIRINATGETLTLDNQFDKEDGVERIVFADGTTLGGTDWSLDGILLGLATIYGTSGNDTIWGSGSDDVIDPGAGNDTYGGEYGSDTMLFGAGYGNDFLNERADGTDTDTLKLIGLNQADVRFERPFGDLTDVIIRINATGETLTLDNQFDKEDGVERIVFADGTTLGGTDWSLDGILQNLVTIYGTSGNDTIWGSSGKDIINGGPGNDTLNGEGGNDTFIYASGDGSDAIGDNGVATDLDVLRLTDLNVADVTFARSGAHTTILVNATGHTITLWNQQSTTVVGIERIDFANGTQWNRTDIAAASWYRGTSGNDTLTGSTANDTIIGSEGNDTLKGLAGNDTFVFGPQFGNDTVADFTAGAGAGDVLRFDSNVFANTAAVLAAASQSGADTVITYDPSNKIILKNVTLSNLHADDFAFV